MQHEDVTEKKRLPLPHPENELEGDVLRLRDALSLIDALLSAGDEKLLEVRDSLVGSMQLLNEAKLGRNEVASVAQGGTGASSRTGARTVLEVPKNNGEGASGTWPISISGSAAKVPFAGVEGRPNTLAGYGIGDALRAVDFTFANLGGKPTNTQGYGITGGALTNSLTGKVSGGDWEYAFGSQTRGGSTASMYNRRGAPFYVRSILSGNLHAGALAVDYTHTPSSGTTDWNGVYSFGIINVGSADPGLFCLHHINSAGLQSNVWSFNGGNGDFISPGNVAAFSDARIKRDIKTIDGALEKVSKMRGVYYVRKDEDTGRRQVGVIAQELREVLPEVVLETKPQEGEDALLTVAYGNMVGVLIEAVKELKAEVDALKKKP